MANFQPKAAHNRKVPVRLFDVDLNRLIDNLQEANSFLPTIFPEIWKLRCKGKRIFVVSPTHWITQ